MTTVLTTNFDQLVLSGMARSGILPVVCDGIESRLEEAVAAYRAALEVITPENTAHYHPMASENLDSVLAEIARRTEAATQDRQRT